MSMISPVLTEVRARRQLVAQCYAPEKALHTPSLADFVRDAWHVIEPATPFTPGPHIDAICHHLEAVSTLHIKRLLVNMPPRHGKSTIISVLWPVWSWLREPSHKWLCASYALSLAIRDNRKCRLLIQSPWFGETFPGRISLSPDQNVKIKFENTRSGYRQAVSVGSAATGEGGDTLLIDDPHSIEDKTSDVKRMAALEWFRDTWSTRLNDQRTGAMVIVGQRIHSQDLSGYLLSGESGEEWVHLNLPAEYEMGNPCKTFVNDTLFWSDWRTRDGELLWSDRFPQIVIDKAKRKHGTLAYAALYQQRPVPAGGNIYKEADRRFFTVDTITQSYLLETPRGVKSVPIADCWNLAVIDLATSEKQSADFFCMETWAITPYNDALLLHIVHDHLAFPEQQEHIYLTYLRFQHTLIAVEKVGYQLAMIQHLISRGLPVRPFEPRGDKVTRSTTGSIFYSNGKAYHQKHMAELPLIEKELFTFPKAPHDDIADCHAMMALVVSTANRPGVWSEGKEAIDPTLSIEHIIDAKQIANEQANQEQERRAQELANPALVINPFAWAIAHEGGWYE